VVDLRILLNVLDLRTGRRMSQYGSEARDHWVAGELQRVTTYIRMPADLLNDIFVEMASITHQ
jgi:hypothetical protein